MMRNLVHTRTVLCTFLLLINHATFGQGPLTPPPGGPTPTMKSLDQVEPRIAITNLPVLINQPGSYYLTQSFAQSFSSTPVSIGANNVTLDFCGFTVQQIGASAVNGMSVQVPQSSTVIKNVVVKNGFLTGFPSSAGIFCFGTRNCIFENLAVTRCGGGMSFQASSTVGAAGNIVRNCRTCDNAGSGIIFFAGAGNIQNVIENCESLNNTSAGFSLAAAGNLIINCRASGNVNNYVIAASNREGLIVQPATNSSAISGPTGGVGSGTTDPYYNLSY